MLYDSGPPLFGPSNVWGLFGASFACTSHPTKASSRHQLVADGMLCTGRIVERRVRYFFEAFQSEPRDIAVHLQML